MIILSIDSSSKRLSVALKMDDSIDQNFVNDERASKVILVEIDKILKKYDIKRETIDYIVLIVNENKDLSVYYMFDTIV